VKLSRALAVLLGLGLGGGGATTGAALAQDDLARMPDGPGKELVYYACSGCHSMKIVFQQRLTRETWDDLLVWMREKQNMPEIPPDDRKVVLDYLTAHYGWPPPK